MKYRFLILSLSLSMSACAVDAKTPVKAVVQFKPQGAKVSHVGHEVVHHDDAHHVTAHNEPRPYDETADAETDIAKTLAAAKAENKKGLLIFGANWCHDSRALAAHFEKPRFQTLIQENYKLVYIDVGQKNRNIDQAQKFGVESIVGTPTIFITNSDGAVLNLDTAPTWRNAASRQEYEVYDYFSDYAPSK